MSPSKLWNCLILFVKSLMDFVMLNEVFVCLASMLIFNSVSTYLLNPSFSQRVTFQAKVTVQTVKWYFLNLHSYSYLPQGSDHPPLSSSQFSWDMSRGRILPLSSLSQGSRLPCTLQEFPAFLLWLRLGSTASTTSHHTRTKPDVPRPLTAS